MDSHLALYHLWHDDGIDREGKGKNRKERKGKGEGKEEKKGTEYFFFEEKRR